MTSPEPPPAPCREPDPRPRPPRPLRLLAALLVPAILAAVVLASGSAGAADAPDGGTADAPTDGPPAATAPTEGAREDAEPTTAAPETPSGRPAVPAETPPSIGGGGEDPETAFVSGRAEFAVAFRDVVTPYRTFLLTALPDERVEIRALPGVGPELPAGRRPSTSPMATPFLLRASAGRVRPLGPDRWEWEAPGRPGYHRLVVHREAGPDSVVLNAAVLVPFDRLREGRVDGYRLGRFPAEPFRGLPQYERPRGFLPLRATHQKGLRVSPHFTLDQFPAKGPAGWPKYLVLEERLLLKLEWLLEEAVRAGVPATTLRVLSGFRSPWYNGSIGRPKYSRHIYGDAADVYVDEDGDGRMDDLNGDGRSDVRDADVLYDIVEAMDAAPETEHFLGGLGKYRVTPNHGPFIHVDTRLYRARW